jgi:hypothetical protein
MAATGQRTRAAVHRAAVGLYRRWRDVDMTTPHLVVTDTIAQPAKKCALSTCLLIASKMLAAKSPIQARKTRRKHSDANLLSC